MALRVATWNINEGRPGDDTSGRYDWVGSARRAETDILLLQECGFTENDVDVKQAGEMLGLSHVACLVYSQSAHTPDGRAGLAILSRYSITSSRSRLFTTPVGSVPPEQIAFQHRFNKGTLTALINTPIGSVHAMNLHSFPFHYLGLTPEAEQASIVWDELAAEAASTSGPLVLGGDFNSRNRELLLDRAANLTRADPTTPPMIDDFVIREVEASAPLEVDHSTRSDHPIVSMTVQGVPPGVSDRRA